MQAPISFLELTYHAGQVVNEFDLLEISYITYARKPCIFVSWIE